MSQWRAETRLRGSGKLQSAWGAPDHRPVTVQRDPVGLAVVERVWFFER
jgi:hypothetical protein